MKERRGVTPRAGGYRDTTVTYIRRAKIPSHMYAKHQYRQESEYRKSVVFQHYSTSTQLSQGRNTIIQEYYITKV